MRFWNGVKGWLLRADKYNIIGTRQVEVSLHITPVHQPPHGKKGLFWALSVVQNNYCQRKACQHRCAVQDEVLLCYRTIEHIIMSITLVI